MTNRNLFLILVLFFNLNFVIQIQSKNYLLERVIKSFQTDSIGRDDSSNGNPSLQKSTFDYNYILLQPSRPNDTSIKTVDEATFNHRIDSLMRIPISRTDSLLYASNPLLMPLVFSGIELKPVWNENLHPLQLAPVEVPNILHVEIPQKQSAETIIKELRYKTKEYLINTDASLFPTSLDRLPDVSTFMPRFVKGNRLNPVMVYDNKLNFTNKKINIGKVDFIHWSKKANEILQFSQNYISPNWYQGGESNFTLLSIFTGELNYDNLKNTQWTNKLEWHVGLSSLNNVPNHKFTINDDLLRYTTKIGIKASGLWFYSVSGDFSTQLFDTYNSSDYTTLKGRLFTPVRANIGVGMDLKIKKIFSLMIAPVTFKYIYLTDTIHVDPNLFGIQKGFNQMKQIGSSFRAELDYSPARNWLLESNLSFYTDYTKVQVDWEIINNFTINRFLTTRLYFNPRYDNTIILQPGEKSKIQMKELMSIGFSFRFI